MYEPESPLGPVYAGNIEAWYDAVREWTIPRTLVPVSVEEVRQMRAGWRPPGLEERLAAAMAAYPAGAFVRTSARSPKDAVHTDITPITEGTVPERLRALMAAQIEAMRCTTADRALTLLLRSERVAYGFDMALEVGGEWREHLSVSPFLDIRPEQEWRCFVIDRRVTAISQYHCLCAFPNLSDPALLRPFLERVIPHVPLASCAIDVALQAAGPIIVEINPLVPDLLGGCLFDWNNPHDSDVLMGRAPFEVRVGRDSPGQIAGLSPEWRVLASPASPKGSP